MADQDFRKLKIEPHQRDFKIKELESLMVHDPLTGLFNRRGFF